jgi:hypothetical protein
VTMESVFGEFVERFDSLTSASKSKVKWGVVAADQDGKKQQQQQQPDPLFALLNTFVDVVSKLTSLDPADPDSLAGKRFGIRNASIARKSLHLEFLVNGELNILELNPAKRRKDDAIKMLFTKSEIVNAVIALMKQA